MDIRVDDARTTENKGKYHFVRAFAWGAGFGLAVALVLVFIYYAAQRPKRWDVGALRVNSVKAEGVDLLDDNFDEKSVGTFFTVDLQNTTSEDITLPESVRVMQEAGDTGTLHGSLLKVGKDYFIPAHHVAAITLENHDLCAAHVEPRVCFDNYFGDQKAIVIFDEMHKFEIRIPMPKFSPPNGQSGPGVPVQNN